MDDAAFATMRRGAYFINAARGELSTMRRCSPRSTPDISAAPRSTSAAPPTRCPRPTFTTHPRVIATPHIGGLTQPAIEHQALETVAQLSLLLRGELPVGAVNPDHADRWRRWRHHQGKEGAA